MKKTTLIALTALAAIALLVPAGSAMAQSSASASATATATIITPIVLESSANLQFGNVVASTAAGTIVVAADATRTWTGGATGISGLPVSAAAFTVGGGANRTFTITLPASTTISAGTNNMTVDTFTSSLGASSTLDGSGAAALTVGGTLNVNASQPAGEYTGTFSVTVAYN
jgi:spore coat protein U-like protein